MTEAEDMETLMAQLEKEYEEAEQKKKAEKKSRKKGGKAGVEGEENADAPKKEPKKTKKEAKPKPAPKPKEEVEEKMQDLNIKEDSNNTEAPKKNKKKNDKKSPSKEPSEEKETSNPEPAVEKSESKSKKGKKDEKPKKNKGVSALKEALAKANQQEQNLIKAEEERQRKEEEARKAKAEQERLEKERKEKKKQKEKERIARKKQEGTFETKEQKEARQRALLQLEAMGVKIPAKTDEAETKKVKPKYGRLRKNKNNDQEKKEEEVKVEEVVVEEVDEVEEEEEVKDSWDVDEDEIKAAKEKKRAAAEKKKAEAAAAAAAKAANDEGEEEDGEDEEEEEESESSEEEEDESEEEEEEISNQNLTPIEKAKLRIQKRHEEAEKIRSTDNLRSPVICVLGHVDTGKTKILDNLRRTKVQEDEAGGITQQIGATNVPLDCIMERTKMARHVYKDLLKIPGLLIIDTPGHESFKSLRTRGSSLCDIAILVIDIMHGLEPQTIESINILKEKKTPFVVALNKIDRLFDWKANPSKDIVEVIESQPENTKREFEKRSDQVILELAEQGLNAALYYKNKDLKNFISLVPTSAHSSDGIGNLMALLIEFSQTILAKRVSFSNDLQCTVMEVKAIPGLGTTVDVCLVNGKLKVCDTIILPGQEGPIVTQVRGLLTPQPNKDLRVKNNHYIMNKEISGARGVKIAAKELEKCMAGLPMFVAQKPDEIEYYKEELDKMLKAALSSIKLSDVGVFVQASTLGSLEALLEFLRTSKIPYAGISIGPVHRKDVIMASIMLERDPQYSVILAFDVKVEKDAQDHADHVGVKIFTADIIYHLFDKFIGYRDELKAKKREEYKDIAVFPFKLRILPEFIFNTRDPIIIGVKITAGFLKIGSPICALCLDASTEREGKDKFVDLGRITSIEFNHKPLEVAKMGQDVCIKIENTSGGAPKLLGRHFLITDQLVSRISRESIDAVKNYFREEMTKADWQLIIELKRQFQIL